MSDTRDDEIAAFVKEHDAMLLAMDRDQYLAFCKKYKAPVARDEIWLLTMHKARTGARSLPMEARRESAAWLTERGHTTMDDGEFAP